MTVLARNSSARLSFAAVAFAISMIWPAHRALATAYVIETIDEAGGRSGTSIAIDAFGNTHVSYNDEVNGNLKYALKSSGAWTIEIVDGLNGFVGRNNSLRLDAEGNPHVSYHAVLPDGAARYARKSGGVWTIGIVEERKGTDTGEGTSLQLDAQGEAHVAYCIPSLDRVSYAQKSGSTWTIVTVITQWEPWNVTPSLALDGLGNASITYLSNDQSEKVYDLKYARRSGPGWVIETADGGDEFAGLYSSLVLDAQGNPYVSYHGGDLRYAWKSGGLWTIEVVAGNGSGNYSSLAFDGQGNPHVAYHNTATQDLGHAWKSGGAWMIEVVDGSSNNAGLWCSLALDAQGNEHISYHDLTTGQLMYAYVAPTSVTPPDGQIELMTVFPNPSRGEGTQVFVRAPADLSEIDLALYDITGRRVASLVSGKVESQSWRASWNGADDAGRRIATGTYWVRLRTKDGGTATERLTVIR